jgi:hypothetical protein
MSECKEKALFIHVDSINQFTFSSNNFYGVLL